MSSFETLKGSATQHTSLRANSHYCASGMSDDLDIM